MKTVARHAAAIGIAILGTAAIAGLSMIPYQPGDGENAVVRLSWRTPAERREECRRVTEEELERLPVHMRRELICEGFVVPYRLVVELDGRTLVDESVRPAGARADRPLYVFREIELAPGEHELRVTWREDLPPMAREAAPPDVAGGEEQQVDAPRKLELRVDLALRPADVTLITYEPSERRLVARGNGVVP